MKESQLRIVVIAVLLLGAFSGLWLIRRAPRPQPAPAPLARVADAPSSPAPVSPAPTTTVATVGALAFSTFGPAKTFLGGSGWAVGVNAHAEPFVPTNSGRLSAIEMALEPNYIRKGREKNAADAEVFLAPDQNGFPGAPLEEFSIVADSPKSPAPTNALRYVSVARPVLEAGKKYWLGARCTGGGSWVWRFNDQNLMQLSAYEPEPGKWSSAGNGRNGAFSIIVTPAP